MQNVDSKNKADSLELQNEIVRLFHSHFCEVLNILSVKFPHEKGDGSQNEIDFKVLRAKILRSGNNKIRELNEILADYSIVKVVDTVIKKINLVKQPFKVPGKRKEKEND